MTNRLLVTGYYGATQTCFLIYYFNDLLACWHVPAIHAGPHVGPPSFCGGPCSDEHTEHASICL